MSASAAPGSNAALLEVAERIVRLTRQQQGQLPDGDLSSIRDAATQVIAVASTGGGQCHVLEVAPAWCGLAMMCVGIVDKAELTTGLARLVSAGCEILAALLLHRQGESVGFEWVESTLEDLCDCMDFLSLEIYCTLGRLESMAGDADGSHHFDLGEEFCDYWGCVQHQQAMQELSAWLLCILFRAVGPGAVTAHTLMEFTNSDPLCLCALLRGFLSLTPDCCNAPSDTLQLHGVALNALCGLTAPELAFPYFTGDSNATDIHEQNKVLVLYLEVLCSAVVETGLFLPAVEAVLIQARSAMQLAVAGLESGGLVGVRFLGFLAALVLQAEQEQPCVDDPWPPGRRLQAEMRKRADELGRLLEAILAAGPGGVRPEYLQAGSMLKELLLSSAGICAALADDHSRLTEDSFTLACRMLLTECLSEDCACFSASSQSERSGLAVLAANVGDLHMCTERLSAMSRDLRDEDRQRIRSRLQHTGTSRLPLRRGAAEVLAIFSAPHDQFPAPSVGPKVGTADVNSATKPGSLRDIVQQAPKEYRCALDGKLLCDPVVAPSGAVFERSTLLRYFQQHGPICPHTGHPLRIEDCPRSAEVRQRVTAWVRGEGSHGKRKAKGRRKKT